MPTSERTIAMLGIGTAVPEYRLDQADTAQRLADALRDAPDSGRWAKRIFKQCGVQTRYTCEPDLLEPADRNRYFARLSGLPVPTTSERMATYKRASVPLAQRAAQHALEDAGRSAADVTHLLAVSCTGQFLPGLDAELTKRLGLPPSVNRIPLTFLGCAAGLKAIGMARDIVHGQPDAVALVVCVELCTLHIQPSAEREALFGASFFGDGASACVIGAADANGGDRFELGRPVSTLLPDCAEEMVWEVGNHGFDLYLSARISALIGQYVPDRLRPLLSDSASLPDIWAIHPGGKGIIDALETELGLGDAHTRYSRSILRDYGNMSSATLLFVLDAIRESMRGESERKAGLCLAFGPGLSCEILPVVYAPPVAGASSKADAARAAAVKTDNGADSVTDSGADAKTAAACAGSGVCLRPCAAPATGGTCTVSCAAGAPARQESHV